MDFNRKFKDLMLTSGLTEEEVAFYLCVLKHPNSTIHAVAKTTSLPKDRAYKVAESLIDKELILCQGERNKKLRANSINQYLENLYKQGRQINRTADSLAEVKRYVPLLANDTEEFSFETFTHEQCGEKFVDMTYLKWDTVLGYGDFESAIPAIGKEADQQFVKRRMKRGGKCFPIVFNPGDYCKEYLIEKDFNELRQTKVVDGVENLDYFVTLVPEANTVGIWNKNEVGMFSGVIVKNKTLTNLHENMFKYFDQLAQNC